LVSGAPLIVIFVCVLVMINPVVDKTDNSVIALMMVSG